MPLAAFLWISSLMEKDGWNNTDDTYSAIGGAEMANVPRTILTLRPTAADGLSVVRVSKRQTTGWKDAQGKFTTPSDPDDYPADYDSAPL